MTHERREAIEKCILMMEYSYECKAMIEYRLLSDRLKEIMDLERRDAWDKKDLH